MREAIEAQAEAVRRAGVPASTLITPEQAAHFAKTMAEFGRAIRVQLVEPALKVGRALHTAAWGSYRSAGMPYGDTEDGMMRWLRERSAAARAEADREAMLAIPPRLRETR